jgi:hypothetical protein
LLFWLFSSQAPYLDMPMVVAVAAIVVVAAIMVAADGMAMGVVGMVEVTIMEEVPGTGLSGLGLDGVDGDRGGVLLTIPTHTHTIILTIHTIRKHPQSFNSSPGHMFSRRNSIFGITVRIPRGTIHI